MSSDSFSFIPFISELAPAEGSSRQMPVGYFRSFTFQPYFAYPSPSSAYSNYYNPLMNWPTQYLPSPPIPAPNFYASAAPFPPTHKPSSTTPQPSLLNFQTIFKSLSASASNLLLDSAPVRSTTISATTTTPQSPTTSSAITPTTTTSSTTPTTPTPELPTTSASVNILDHTIPLISNRLDGGDSRHFHAPSQAARVPLKNRRSDVAPSWNRQAFQQPISDALIQQYFSNFLAAPHVHVVPCMCSMAMGTPPMASMPDFLSPSSRSEDIEDVESDTMDSVIDDQSIANKLIE